MILTTTPNVTGKEVISYCGVVGAEVIFGANFFKDLVASVTDIVGGRSSVYEKVFSDARMKALTQLEEKARAFKANAVVSIRFDYQAIGNNNSMMMVAATGTAVMLSKTEAEKEKERAFERDQQPSHFVKIDGIEKGPFSIEQLGQLSSAGKVSLYAQVRTEGLDDSRILAHVIAR